MEVEIKLPLKRFPDSSVSSLILRYVFEKTDFWRNDNNNNLSWLV